MTRRLSQSPNKLLQSLPPRLLQVGRQYELIRDGRSRTASVLDVRLNRFGQQEAYISVAGEDKRLDRWVQSSELGESVGIEGQSEAGPSKRRKINVVRATPEPAPSGSAGQSRNVTPSAQSTPEREHANMTRVRNFEDVRFGEYLIRTWYYSPYPLNDDTLNPSHVPNGKPSLHRTASGSQIANGHDYRDKGKSRASPHPAHLSNGLASSLPSANHALIGSRGRLFVCDLCFKYSLSLASWQRHSSSCSLLLPPGRKVYQRGSYTIWEIDGAQEPLYCQNLSLFGKLFIDHKSIFFHVEGFLFYVLCDAATSRRDQVMAFFSKEKLSYDDYNLACIVTFPPFQNRAFGKLLIEFSYFLTRHPSTRPSTFSPGTPERPLSDLGLKGYTAYWVAVVLRVLKQLLAEAEPFDAELTKTPKKGRIGRGSMSLRRRSSIISLDPKGEDPVEQEDQLVKRREPYRGQYSVSFSLAALAKACHLRVDDTAYTLGELGFLRRQRPITDSVNELDADQDGEGQGAHEGEDEGEWSGKEVVVSRDQVDNAWVQWNVRDKGVLDEDCLLL